MTREEERGVAVCRHIAAVLLLLYGFIRRRHPFRTVSNAQRAELHFSITQKLAEHITSRRELRWRTPPRPAWCGVAARVAVEIRDPTGG